MQIFSKENVKKYGTEGFCSIFLEREESFCENRFFRRARNLTKS